MKKLFILLTICLSVVATTFAQKQDSTGYYNMFSVKAATNGLTPVAAPKPGLTPSDSFLPCAVRGVAVSDTIIFTNYDSVTYQGQRLKLTSLKIDSLYLPSGLTWSTNSSTNTFAGRAAGAILVQGTTYDTAGQYKLRIIVTAVVSLGGFPVTQAGLDAETNTGLAYRVRVVNPAPCVCPIINSSTADSTRVFIPFAACLVGINDISNDISNVSVVPNPFATSAHLIFNSSIEGNYTVRMTNLIGAVVSSEEKNIVRGSNEVTIERNGLSAGIYLLSISNGSSSISRKVIVE